MPYLATINVPGYLPMDDDPPVFDDVREAWDYLLDERRRGEDDAIWDGSGDEGYSATLNILESLADGHDVIGLLGVDTSSDLTGSVYGPTPGREADDPYDLGLAYSVSAVTLED